MSGPENEDIIDLSPKDKNKLETFRDDLFMLRCKCGLSLSEASELCGFTESEIRAQEEKRAPLHVGIVVALSLVYYILIMTEDKETAKSRLRGYVQET